MPLPQPSRECTVKNSFTQRETGYIRKEQLLKFLRTNFGANKEYGIQVYALAQHQLSEELLLIQIDQTMNERWSFYAPRKVTYVSASSPSESAPIVSAEPF